MKSVLQPRVHCILAISLLPCLCAAQDPAQQSDLFAQIRTLRREPNLQAEGLIRLALLYSQARQYRLFVLTIKHAAELEPSNYLPHYYLGRYSLAIVEDFAAARAALLDALRRKPNETRCLYYLGLCDERENRIEAAEQNYGAAIREAKAQSTLLAEPFVGMARLRLRTHDVEGALSFARLAVSYAPSDASAHRILAKCFDQSGLSEQSEREWSAAAALEPNDAPTLYSLYRAQKSRGKAAESERTLERFRQVAQAYAPE